MSTKTKSKNTPSKEKAGAVTVSKQVASEKAGASKKMAKETVKGFEVIDTQEINGITYKYYRDGDGKLWQKIVRPNGKGAVRYELRKGSDGVQRRHRVK